MSEPMFRRQIIPPPGPLTRVFLAVGLIVRSMTTRPVGGKKGRITETRESSDGVHYDLYHPPHPVRKTIITVQGMTLLGERDPRLINFCRGMAESGFRVAAIELPGLKSFRFDPEDLTAIVNLAAALYSNDDRPVGLIGFSVGAGLALTAAAAPSASKLIDPVLLFGPYHSLLDAWTRILNKQTKTPAGDVAWENYIYIRMMMAYRAMDRLDMSETEKNELIEQLNKYCSEPVLDVKKEFFNRVLKNRDIPAPFPAASDVELLERLSPCGKLTELTARVLILHDQFDDLILPKNSEKIYDELKRRSGSSVQKILVTPLLSHVMARYTWRIFDVWRILDIMGELFR